LPPRFSPLRRIREPSQKGSTQWLFRHAITANRTSPIFARRSPTSTAPRAVVQVGTLPIGAIVLRGGVVVTTAFNAATTNVLDIGTVADDDGFATDLAMGTIGVIVADEMATSNDMGPFTADTSIIATHSQTGTAATAGEGYVWIEYMPVA
jgi:hypothetical protein